MGEIIAAIFYLLISVISFIEYLLIGYIILGWVVFFGVIKNRDSVFLKIYVFLMTKLEPMLGFVRRFIPSIGGLDFSALVVFAGLHIAKRLVVQICRALLMAIYG